MSERIDRDYRYARRASLLGSIALYAIALLSLAIGAHLACADFPPAAADPGARRVLLGLSTLAFAGADVLLAEFLRHFGSGSEPFGRAQSARLILAALLLASRTVLDALAPSSALAAALGAAAAVPLAAHAAFGLKVVSVVVFLVCIAMVVRYGDALKEDSDAFV